MQQEYDQDGPVVTIESIKKFSQCAFHGDYNSAVGECINILHTFERQGVKATRFGDEARAAQALTLFAAGVTAMIANPGFELNRQGFGALISLKSVLRRLFSNTSFVDMSHLFPLLGNDQDGQVSIPERSTHKFLLTCTLDIAPPQIFEIFQTIDQESQLLFWLSLLDSKILLEEEQEAIVAKLIVKAGEIKPVALRSVGEVDLLNRVWFQCSFWDLEGKHSVKRLMNRVFKETGKSLGIKEQKYFPPRVLSDKPRLLIVLDIWLYNSSMYRCFGKALNTLRERFYVTAFVKADQIDDRTSYVFDEVINFSESGNYKDFVVEAVRTKPDMIYYPSVGMNAVSTMMAQFRLAPVQIMSLGHPATSCSDAIDYVVIEDDLLADPDCFSEQLLLVRQGAFQLTQPDFEQNAGEYEREGDEVRIVVNSMYQKLTPRFLRLCAEVTEESSQPVQFIFLCGSNAIDFDTISESIKKKLPATVYPMMPYKDYSQIIGGCDIQLTPFPFGNTNSFIDAAILGVPTICMDGPEIHSHNDVVFSRRVGLPDSCVASDYDEYKAAVLRLSEDEAMRQEIRQLLQNADIDEALFGRATKEQEADLLNLFSWVLENHNEIKKSQQKVWDVEARKTIGAV